MRRARAGELEAYVLAAAGLRRLGLRDEAAMPLDPAVFIPAPGQGCLAVEAAEDATTVLGLLSEISHQDSRLALRAERAFLARLGGSCTLPAGAHLPPPGRSAYATAKSAQIGLTNSWARELAPFGITVNTVAPGFIPVERHADVPTAEAEAYRATVPAGRLGSPEDVAHAVSFFASEAFITGQRIVVDGVRRLAG